MTCTVPSEQAAPGRRAIVRWARTVATALLAAAAATGCAPTGALVWPEASGRPRLVAAGMIPPRSDAMARPRATAAPAVPATATVPASTTAASTAPRRATPGADGSLVRTRGDDPLPPLPPSGPLPPALPPGSAAPAVASDPGPPARDGQPAPSVPPADRGEYAIDLNTALRLAEAENPVIAGARVRIGEALALQQQARALLLPSLNAGVNYHGHVGNLQRSSGRILNLSEQSLYVGGGAGASAAGTVGLGTLQDPTVNFASPTLPERPASVPAVNIASPLADAFFEPLAARQEVAVAEFEARATANDVLREVAELQLDLIAAYADLAYRRETARQESEVARLTREYADAKQGRQADAERALTELALVEREIHQAEEELAVNSARLVRRLHLDPTVRLRPVAPGLEPFTLVDPGVPLEGLLQVALRGRPEVGARNAGVVRAEVRHRQEVYRPLLPTLFVGFSGGGFGGGSNLVRPTLGNFAGRTDFDVGLFWTLENFGMGNLSRMKRRQAELGQAVGAQSETMAAVRAEVGSALAEALATRPQLAITADRLRSAERGFEEDLIRIRNVVGRPVEAVNSLRLLNEARAARVRAVTDYNKAQVRLFVALGSPPPLERPATEPLPPAPIAAPPVRPLPNTAAAAGTNAGTGAVAEPPPAAVAHATADRAAG